MSILAIFKPIGQEISVTTTGEDVGLAKLVRIVNDTETAILIEVLDEEDVVYSSFTMQGLSEKLLQKNPAYKIRTGAGTVKVVKASF